MTDSSLANALVTPRAFGHVKPDEDTTPPVPRFLRPDLFPGPIRGPWKWPALEDARTRHQAAVEAYEAAHATEDAEAERDALVAVVEAVEAGVHAIRMTSGSAKNAYTACLQAVKDRLPIDENGVITAANRPRYSQMMKEAKAWTEPDKLALGRCWSMTEADTQKADGSGIFVARVVADAEIFRLAHSGEFEEAGGASVDHGEASFEDPDDGNSEGFASVGEAAEHERAD
jgi:hypothetical protein